MFGKKKQEVKQEEQPRTETIIVKGLDEKSQGVNMPIPPAPPKRDTLGEILWPEFTKDFMYWNTEDLIRMTEAEKEVMNQSNVGHIW